jgi:Ser/Thr protein kinase RdoA (MazF antagonist)
VFNAIILLIHCHEVASNNHKKIMSLKSILKEFDICADEVVRFGTGHINETYKVTAGEKDYILQKINSYVFPKPNEIMENIVSVTEFLREKIASEGGNPERETLHFIPNKSGKYYSTDEDGHYWRVMYFIENTVAYEKADNLDMLRKSGAAFGKFQSMLKDFPAEKLHEVIENFHNTPERVNQLKTAIKENKSGRLGNVETEINFALERENAAAELMNMLSENKLPLKVTHNDTKMANILVDDKTDEPVCVIDLDTIMPGLTAYDFGDSIRSGATTALEDEADLSKVNFSLEKFKAYAEGFLSVCGKDLTENELYSLSVGAKLMTYECGIRFLADYLNGDVYFNVAYDEHNLVRARNQFKLVSDMEKNMDKMHAIVKEAAQRS